MEREGAGIEETTTLEFKEGVEFVGKALDVAGVAVIVGGIVLTTITHASGLRGEEAREQYRQYRRGIGRAILLGLEILVGADIIRTVAVDPTFESAGVLAIIVVIRTFLSFSLEVELEGRWPWQRQPTTSGNVAATTASRP